MNEESNDPEKNPEVPEQKEGTRTGAEHRRKFDSDAEATNFFKEARERYLNINNWGKYSGMMSATFRLCNKDGKEVDRKPLVGDYIKIDLPGPGPEAGDMFDWVCIEEIHGMDEAAVKDEIDEYFAMVTRPAPHPAKDGETIAHFYDEGTTSTFLLQRVGNEVVASEEGRNEKLNIKGTGTYDTIRNTAVGTGARSGVSYLQWKALMKGIMEADDSDM